ncbi:hypothetical protein KSX_85360 [Ktedonospora formicarum]|uniref:Uncharacterized protein n=1 Tax=Ktedonospora formicarum TaxID=2778364 RepID=A0A8J3IDM8_9CHLR|nr:hypothetical protein KSX_85360 [Ktedonospora formicarum]
MAAALDQDIEHISVLVYRSPKRVFLPANREDDLVHVREVLARLGEREKGVVSLVSMLLWWQRSANEK